MFELLRSPWEARFNQLLDSAERSLVLCSPYIGRRPCERVRARLSREGGRPLEWTVLTDLSRDNMLSGSVDVAALADLATAAPQGTVRFLPSLHAKVYIADESCAIITSGNLTASGLSRNFEYGVACTTPDAVRAIKQDILGYAALGSSIDAARLRLFAQVVDELRQARQALEHQARAESRHEFDQRVREMDAELLGVRVAGRTAHAIFADTILHLLGRGPATTVELNEMIRGIHPDLCDDSVDRVIQGQHFGKKWKHGVRTAQVYLRRRGNIQLRDGYWHLVEGSTSGDGHLSQEGKP